MNARTFALLSGLLMLCASLGLKAQDTLPAAPSSAAPIADAPSAVVKPSFTLPKTPGTLASSHAAPPPTPVAAEFCFAPATGLYGPQPEISAHAKELRGHYLTQATQHVAAVWHHNMPRSVNDPWLKRAVVTIRFAILPNGEIDEPLVTATSGRVSYDRHALETLEEAAPFDPLPPGLGKALTICFHFTYHPNGQDEWEHKPKDLLPYPTKPPA